MYQKILTRSNFVSQKIFSKNLIAIYKAKEVLKIIKPCSTLLKISISTNIIESIGRTDNVFKAFKFISDNFSC